RRTLDIRIEDQRARTAVVRDPGPFPFAHTGIERDTHISADGEGEIDLDRGHRVGQEHRDRATRLDSARRESGGQTVHAIGQSGEAQAPRTVTHRESRTELLGGGADDIRDRHLTSTPPIHYSY